MEAAATALGRRGAQAQAAEPDGAALRILYGTDEPVPVSIALRAGPLDLTYRAGKILHIRLGEHEIWHAVTFSFRDPDWGTPEPVLTLAACEVDGEAFRLVAEGVFPVTPPIDLRLEIEGGRDGHIRVRGEATPRGDILTNRLGLCVLHPLSAAGRAVEIAHDDGRRSASTLPVLVPPWPPFMGVRAVRHEYAPGRWARCELAGDVFEFEDQRNNADASFKTYSRSNLMPRPYLLPAGTIVRQSAELRLEGARPARPTARNRVAAIAVRVEREVVRLPRIGIEVAAGDLAPPPSVRQALGALRPAQLHMSVEDGGAEVDWPGIGSLLAESSADLRLDIVAPDEAHVCRTIEAVARTIRGAGLLPEAVAVFPSSRDAVALARGCFPAARIGGGTPHFFAQLNRAERLGDLDFVSFTTSPLVHGADDELVMQSLQSLPSLLETARVRHRGLPIRVGPSGIGIRRSPLGNQPDTDGLRRVAMARRDPRSRGLYGAAWALGHIAQLASAGAETISLMSLTGDAGLIDLLAGGELVRHPASFVLARLGGASGMLRVSNADPARLAALAFVRDGARLMLLANLTAAPLEVAPEGDLGDAQLSVMDAESWDDVSACPDGWAAGRRGTSPSRLRLGPYAVALLEAEGPADADGKERR